MIKVKDQNGKIHDIDIKKVERLESDGTFIIHGKENNYNVVLHVIIDELGEIHKLPHSPTEYIRLMVPFTKKVNVTDSLKAQLEGQTITENKKKEPKKPFRVFLDKPNMKVYVTLTDAGILGYLNNISSTPNIITDENNIKFYELSDIQFEKLKDDYDVNIAILNKSKKDDIIAYMKKRIADLLINMRYFVETEKNIDYLTKNLIIDILNRNKMISILPDSTYKEELFRILYYDLMDMQSTGDGLNLSNDRAVNYNRKFESMVKLFEIRGKNIDFTNVQEILLDIGRNLTACVNLDGIIEPRVWFLVEQLLNRIIEKILTCDDDLLREEIKKFDKNNLMYGQIMYDLENHLYGRNQEIK